MPRSHCAGSLATNGFINLQLGNVLVQSTSILHRMLVEFKVGFLTNNKHDLHSKLCILICIQCILPRYEGLLQTHKDEILWGK